DIGEFTHVVKNTVRQDFFMGRVDHQLTGSTSIFGRYQFDDDKNINDADDNNLFRDVGERNNARRMYSTLQANTVISPTLINSARFAFNRSAQFSDAYAITPLAEQLAFVPGKDLIGTITIGEARGNPVFAEVGSDTNYPRFWVWNNFEWGDDMTFSKDRHTFKWGGVIKRWQSNNTVQSEGRGQYTFEGLRNMLTGRVNQFRGVPIGEEGYKGIRMTQMGFYFQDDFRVSSRLTLNMGLRWEMSSDPTESNNQVSNLLDALDRDVAVHPQYALPGQQTIDAFFKTGKKNFQPRFGFAWQMNDSATRVIRGGFGIYHDLAHPFLFNQQASKYPPFFHRLQVDGTESFRVPFPNAAPLLSSGSLAAIQMEPMWPEMPSGTKYNFNLSIQQSWGQRGVFEIGYVGSQARHITRYQQLNYPNYEVINGHNWYPARINRTTNTTAADCIFTTSPLSQCWSSSVNRRNPAFNRIRTKTNDSNSHYNGLQMKLQRTFAAGPQFQVSYTFSKVMDQQGGLNNGDNGQRDQSSSLDPHDSAREWGRAAHDATHVLSSNFTYPLPFQFSSGVANAFLGGWEFTGLSLIMSGQPITPQLQVDYGRTGNAGAGDRPDLVSGRSLNPTNGVTASGQRLRTADRWYDPTAFTWPNPLGLPVPQLGFLGNVGRGTIIGPNIVNFDMTLMKNFRFTENTTLQFRAEFFNIFNHGNLG
ncbi:MAG: TonB-dependent receptor domain-containing protein, partial [Terriglobia bacterium]